MQLSINLDALTPDDLAVVDAFLAGGDLAAREDLIDLLEQVVTSGDLPGSREASWKVNVFALLADNAARQRLNESMS